ncbi:transposase [Hoeflea sp.]|uniref:transposase n=1 Tax=Hoeflea sp. TaxID=1940281 RepID=UPI003B020031
MADIGLSAFSIFFMQSPSFLSHQREMQAGNGCSNCQTLFGIKKLPSDNHIRSMLDEAEPQHLFGQFDNLVDHLKSHNGLEPFRCLDGRVLIALDGTEYFCSRKLHCRNCSHRKRNDGGTEYFHTMVSAAVVVPGDSRAIPLQPEFISPQDGHAKQDCERNAVKRWLAANGKRYASLKPVYLGDDLYANQPIVDTIQSVGGDFILTAKSLSHKTLYEWLDGAEINSTKRRRIKKGRKAATHIYRWLNDVPLRDGKDATHVNWFEIEIINTKGKTTYRNSFVTNIAVDETNVGDLAACGRARWKIENETFNVLKTRGYNLEHNFGHGDNYLASVLATLNLLAFAMHTVCDVLEALWKKARSVLAARYRFFDHIRTIVCYLIFPDWGALIRTLVDGEPPPTVKSARKQPKPS